jgi:hypothetical protein
MGLSMKFLASLAIFLLFVSGCSSESKSDYDELQVLEYEKCIDAYIDASDLDTSDKFKVSEIMRYAYEECSGFKPVKK